MFETLYKSDGSPATAGDKNAEHKIIEIISQAFPSHKLIGEEFGEINRETIGDYTWAFDPIDGTWSFINQENTACVNIILLKNNTPILSVVYNPFTNELYKTSKKGKTSLNDIVLPVTKYDSFVR